MGLDIELIEDETGYCLFYTNITHNLIKMADAAGLYQCVWNPVENGWTKPKHIIDMLKSGIELLKSTPEQFIKFEPDNKWGTYPVFIKFLEEYLHNCDLYPESIISTSG